MFYDWILRVVDKFFLLGSIFFCAKDEMFRFSSELGRMNIWLSEWNVAILTYIFMYVCIMIEFELEFMQFVDKLLYLFGG